MTIKCKLDSGAYLLERAHETDAGFDLKSREDAIVPSGGSYVFDTGIHLELQYLQLLDGRNTCGWPTFIKLSTVGFLKSKSGLNVNHNITGEGVIDQGYTGSIRVKLYNHGKEDYHVKKGDKISQLVILPILTPDLELVNHLDDTERGDKGFGSSGK